MFYFDIGQMTDCFLQQMALMVGKCIIYK